MSPPATALSSSRTSLTSGSSQRRRHRRCSSPRPTCAGSRAAPRRRRRGASPPPSGRRGSSWVPPSPPWRRATAPASTTLRCGGRSARPAGWWCRSTRAPSTRGTWSPPFTTGSVRRAPCRGSLHGARCMPGRCSGSRRRRRSCPRLPRRGSTAAGRGPRRCSSSTRGSPTGSSAALGCGGAAELGRAPARLARGALARRSLRGRRRAWRPTWRGATAQYRRRTSIASSASL
mmetsp:Transcript_1707/g.5530  ORF Transcript_1707/g.5530 Transcript_1707/m.5530 type:complete len:232 (-) Transcript_1707:180-875(-)